MYRHMGLPVFDGVQEALERHSVQQNRKLERVQTTPVKRRRVQLKKMRVQDGIRRSDWTKKNGHDHTYGCDDKSVSDHEEAGNQHKRSKGATRANILCSACRSSTHKRRIGKERSRVW